MAATSSLTRIEQRRVELQDLAHGLRTEARGIDDPRASALLETSAEVLEVLIRAFYRFGAGDGTD